MVDVGSKYDTAIIDEIQMMADPQRGWAFTQALLGLQSETIFLCGEEAAVPLIEKLCKETGDTLEVKRFKRLSPLSVCQKPLGDYQNIQPGDCVVTFSRRQIFDVKAQIERATNKKCAVVYGNLPMGNTLIFFSPCDKSLCRKSVPAGQVVQ
jgi:ATP-dependent RNA helicase SUPV3L1/SUV3